MYVFKIGKINEYQNFSNCFQCLSFYVLYTGDAYFNTPVLKVPMSDFNLKVIDKICMSLNLKTFKQQFEKIPIHAKNPFWYLIMLTCSVPDHAFFQVFKKTLVRIVQVRFDFLS